MLLKRLLLMSALALPMAGQSLRAEEVNFFENNGGCQSCQSCDCQTCNPCDTCDCNCDGWGQRVLCKLQESDRCFYDFISPMTNPVFFEDPRTLTEARAIFVQHRLPPALGGTSLRVIALQLRAAITEDLSIIATKDGFIMADPNSIVDDGWADVAAGLKYNLYKDYENQQIVSAGLTFELPVGTARALQNQGTGEFNLFLTGGALLTDTSHWVSTFGWRLPTDHNAESTCVYWSNHFDKRLDALSEKLYAFTEFNWYHWTRDGNGGVPGVAGLDFFNLGSTGVSGRDVVTQAVGLKVKTGCYNEIGVAFEFPLTTRHDVIDNRITADWIFRY